MHRRAWIRSALGASAAYWAPSAYADTEPDAPPRTAPEPPGAEAMRPAIVAARPSCLNPELQRAAAKLLAGARPLSGAAVLVHVRTGELLSFEQFRSRPGLPDPLLSAFPAASVFKLVTTAALLEGGQVDPRTRVCIVGGEHAIERVHLEPALGPDAQCSAFFSALGFSRNAVYAQLATHHLPRTQLLETAERFGFNVPLPFDLPATVGRLELPYNDLEFARAAAGFQGSQLTPIGAAHIGMTIARGGEPLRFRLTRDEAPSALAAPRLPRVISATTARRLARMMEVTIHSGTCRQAFSNEAGKSYLGNIGVAGKTGTLRPESDASAITSWFLGFAPSRAPEVVVAVMLQNGPVWRRKANEVARDLLRCYFADRPLITDPFAKPAPTDLAKTALRP